jgi:hypothetical protein
MVTAETRCSYWKLENFLFVSTKFTSKFLVRAWTSCLTGRHINEGFSSGGAKYDGYNRARTITGKIGQTNSLAELKRGRSETFLPTIWHSSAKVISPLERRMEIRRQMRRVEPTPAKARIATSIVDTIPVTSAWYNVLVIR